MKKGILTVVTVSMLVFASPVFADDSSYWDDSSAPVSKTVRYASEYKEVKKRPSLVVNYDLNKEKKVKHQCRHKKALQIEEKVVFKRRRNARTRYAQSRRNIRKESSRTAGTPVPKYSFKSRISTWHGTQKGHARTAGY